MTTLQTSINCPNERVSPGLSPSFFSKWLKKAVVIHAITMRPHTDRQQRRVRPPSRLTCTSEKCHNKREKIIDFSPCPPTSRAPRLTSKVHRMNRLYLCRKRFMDESLQSTTFLSPRSSAKQLFTTLARLPTKAGLNRSLKGITCGFMRAGTGNLLLFDLLNLCCRRPSNFSYSFGCKSHGLIFETALINAIGYPRARNLEVMNSTARRKSCSQQLVTTKRCNSVATIALKVAGL